MLFFILCTLIIFAILALACILIRHHNRKHPFRARLTIVFLLFVAAPTIPLTLITASLLSGSARILLPEQINQALILSIDCLKSQIAEHGRQFLRNYPRQKDWNHAVLASGGINRISVYDLKAGSNAAFTLLQRDPDVPVEIGQFSDRHLKERYRLGESSSLVPVQGLDWVVFYHSFPDSMLTVLFYPVDKDLANAHHRIQTALTMVNALSLFKESILQKNILRGLAITLISGLLLLTWAVSRQLSRGMTQPVNALVSGMEKVAAGDLAHQVQVRARDEFKYLVDQFNSMTRDLRDTHQKLIEAERLAAWQTVARQISHEIRNSLTPLSLSLHRIRKRLDDSTDDKILESLQVIDEELALLKNMASSFSDFARMPDPKPEPVSLNDLVRASVLLMTPGFRHIRFHITPDQNLPMIHADQDQFKRMINNLIKNGAESIREKGDIWIGTEQDPGQTQVILSIADNGAGMPGEILLKVFEPYFTTKERGTGLGLAMVKRIVESHQGKIEIQSRPGEGTRVTLRFPIC